jgi:multiple sugar transport system permease protein
MISPAIYFNVIMGCIGVLQIFALPYVMTGPGPARSTYFYTMYLFDVAFQYLQMGYACALAWVLFLLILGLTVIAHKTMNRHVYYMGK